MPGAIVKRGEEVTLRTLEIEDVDVLQVGAADPNIRHLTGNSEVRNRAELEATLEEEHTTLLLVCTEDSGRPGPVESDSVRRIGIVSVREYRNPRLGIWLLPDVHGDGYGKEATELLVDYVFRSTDTQRVTAKAFDYNDSSQGLLESMEFTQEGRIRKDAFLDGEYRDGLLYGLLREEWGKN